MLISLNWLGDFVDLPESLDPRELAERLTLTCAEVEEVIQVSKGERTPAETVATVDDWVIEVDNKSITHRPDLWGHYGIAREVAAMFNRPLKPLPVAEGDFLDDESRPEIPIEIDDPKACPRYSGIMLEGVSSQPSPEAMQARLAAVGMRPLSALVDLTNYVMAELGQPLHAFDGGKVEKIEVAVSKGGEKFTTLDAVRRTIPAGGVMIQSGRKNVAIAGIMGGLDTEVTALTKSLFLESATFDAASIRLCATAMAHRTEASARFEKSLDPAMTVLAIARFIYLAQQQFPGLKLSSRLSDCFPDPPKPLSITIDPDYVCSFIGKNVSLAQMKEILEAIEFKVTDHEDQVEVLVPSFRATKDIEGEADIIEEIARFVGYGNVEPQLPQVTMRQFEPNGIHRLERRSLQLLCFAEGYHEIHDYLWYHNDWLKCLGYTPPNGIALRNPPASGLEKLRHCLAPGLLRAADLNRRELPSLKMIQLGSVFKSSEQDTNNPEDLQARHLGLLSMARSKKADERLLDDMKGSLAKWGRELFARDLHFTSAEASQLPWESQQKTVDIHLAGDHVGRATVVPLALRRRIDEHLTAWSIAIAEINLTPLAECKVQAQRLASIPEFPIVQLDFSVLIDAARRYQDVRGLLEQFDHALLKRLSFEGSYQGKNLPGDKRSLLLRARIGDDQRTLNDADIKGFTETFEQFLGQNSLEIRR